MTDKFVFTMKNGIEVEIETEKISNDNERFHKATIAGVVFDFDTMAEENSDYWTDRLFPDMEIFDLIDEARGIEPKKFNPYNEYGIHPIKDFI